VWTEKSVSSVWRASIRLTVHLVGPENRGLGVHLANDVANGDENHGEVVGDEGGVVKLLAVLGGEEDGPAREEDDERNDGESNPSTRAGKARTEGKLATVETLGIHTSTETDVGDTDTNVDHETTDGDKVDEPVEDGVGVLVGTHVGETTGERGCNRAENGRTVLCGDQELLGQVTLASERIERTGGDVDISIGGRPRGRDQTAIDDVGQDLDTGTRDGNDERRGGSITGGAEMRVVRGTVDTDDEGTSRSEGMY